MKVLIVEDEKLISEGIKAIIEALSPEFTVSGVAANGLEAISLLEEDRPDLVVTDVRMPGMDGLELLHHIQTFHPLVAAVVLSGYDDYPYMRKAIQGNAVDYLLKPVQSEQLEEALRKAASRRTKALAGSDGRGREVAYQFDRLIRYVHEKWFDQWIHGEEPMLDDRFYGETRLTEIADLRIGSFAIDYASREEFAKDDRLASLAAFQIAKESAQSETNFMLFRSRQGELLFVVDSAAECTNWFEMTEAIAGNLESHLRVPVFACVSSVVPSVTDLYEAYAEISHLSHARLLGGARIVVADRLSPLPEEPVLEEITACLTRGGYKEGFALAARAATDIAQSGEDPRVREAKARRLCLACWRELFGKLGEASHSRAFFELFLPQASPQDSRAMETRLRGWAEATGSLAEASGSPAHALVAKAQAYMEENYREELTLTAMADYVHLNAAYFSVLYKQASGVNFVDSLNKIRIAKAKALLKDHSLKIYEIADSVGYGSVQHFMKTFRALAGTTPSEYRQTISRTAR